MQLEGGSISVEINGGLRWVCHLKRSVIQKMWCGGCFVFRPG